MCHTPHRTPTIRLEARALYLVCNFGKANPRQPTPSNGTPSNTCPRKMGKSMDQDQKIEIKSLPGMQDDGEPMTATTSRGPPKHQCRPNAARRACNGNDFWFWHGRPYSPFPISMAVASALIPRIFLRWDSCSSKCSTGRCASCSIVRTCLG